MSLAITLKGIDQAISNLNYKNNESLKYRLVSFIRQNYTSEGSVESLKSIPSDDIVKALWDTGDDFKAIKARRKNLNTIKSSVNTDFKSLYHQGKNPEGTIIGPDNTFVMSDEAKDKALEDFGYELKNPGKISTTRIKGLLQTVNDAFADPENSEAIEQTANLTAMDKIRSIIKELSETVGLADLRPANERADNPFIPSGRETAPLTSQNVDTQIEHGSPSKMDEAKVGSGIDETSIQMEEKGAPHSGVDKETDVRSANRYQNLENDNSQDGAGPEDFKKGDNLRGIGAERDTTGTGHGEKGIAGANRLVDRDVLGGFGDQHLDVGNGQEPGMNSADQQALKVGCDPGSDEGERMPDATEDHDFQETIEFDEPDAFEDVEEIDESDPEEVIEELEDIETDDVVEEPLAEDDVEAVDVSSGGSGTQNLSRDSGQGVLGPENLPGDTAPGHDIESVQGENVLKGGNAPGGFGGQNLNSDGSGGEFTDRNGQQDAGFAGGSDSFENEKPAGDIEPDAFEDVEEIDESDSEVEEIDDTDPEVEEIDDTDSEEVIEELEDIETDDVVEESLAEDDVEAVDVSRGGSGTENLSRDSGQGVLGPENLPGDTAPGHDIESVQGENVLKGGNAPGGFGGQNLNSDGSGGEFTDRNGQQDAGFAGGSDSFENEKPAGDIEPDAFEDVEEIDDTDPEVEEIDDTDPEVEEIDDTDPEEVIEELEEENDNEETGEEIGLPVESLGSERSYEHDDDIREKRLLSEEFDEYLGTMDRYYNHYILIPGGNYIVGSNQPRRDEKSERVVRLESFYLGRFPVTNALFEIFVEKTGYKTTAEKVGHGTVYYGRFQRTKDAKTGFITSTWNSSIISKTLEGACWYQPFGPGSMLHNKRNHPVVQISREDAMAFAAWTGKRLPTEDEWEAAARTANGWKYPWGEDWREDCCNLESSGLGNTTAVDKYLKIENEFGIVDTIGNVLEWTIDGLGAMNPDETERKHAISKGGSWISGDDVRLTSRFRLEPETHSNILGFRCVAY